MDYDTTKPSTPAPETSDSEYVLNKGEAFIITDWHDRFENAQTRRTQHLNQVMMPLRGNSGEQRRILSMPGGYQVLAIWHLLIQFAAECPQRGLLVKGTGALDYEDLAFELGVPEEDVRAAFMILSDSKIGWIDTTDCPQNLLVSGSLRSGRNKKVHPRVVMVMGQDDGPDFQQDVTLIAKTCFEFDHPEFETMSLLTPDFRKLYEMDKSARLLEQGVSEHGVHTPDMPAYPDVNIAMGDPILDEIEEEETAATVT